MLIRVGSNVCGCACQTIRMVDAGAVAERIRQLTTRQKMLLALLGGAVVGLGQPPLGWVWLALLGLLGGFLLAGTSRDLRQAGWIGWAFGTGYFAASMFWLVEPFLVDVATDGWMAPFALIGMAGGLALFWALAFVWAHWLGGRTYAPFILALTLATAELARSYVLTGFPWGLIGYIWIDTSVVQIAALIGPHGLTLLTLLLVAVIAGTVQNRGVWRWSLAAVLSLTLVLAAGRMLDRPAGPLASPATGPIVRLIQPNAEQKLKWDPDMRWVFLQRQIDFTAAAPIAGPRPDLIVWPETSVPYLLENAGPVFERITAAAQGRPVVLGINRRDADGYYNSLVALNEQAQVSDIYDKHHLVPFGEYIPGGQLISRLGSGGLAARAGQGFQAGAGAQLIDIPGLGQALPLICYEAIFPQGVGASATRPDFLLQITNDAWFGKISGPYQHLAQARMRAIEQGLPMIRAANTGISAVIDPRGKITASLALGTAGWLDAVLPPKLEPTIYGRLGDFPVIMLLILAGLGLSTQRFRFSN